MIHTSRTRMEQPVQGWKTIKTIHHQHLNPRTIHTTTTTSQTTNDTFHPWVQWKIKFLSLFILQVWSMNMI